MFYVSYLATFHPTTEVVGFPGGFSYWSYIDYRTIALNYFGEVKRKNEGRAYAVSKFPCRLKTTAPFGDYYGWGGQWTNPQQAAGVLDHFLNNTET